MSLPVPTLFWGIVGALVCGSMIPLEPNMLEEGLILEIAQRLIRGQHLYQDVVAFTGPLPYEALALLFRVFGEEVLVGRVAIAILHGCATAGAFALARKTRNDGLEHVAGAVTALAPILLFPLYSTYFYTTIAVSIGVLASWTALLGLRDLRWAVASGVLVACVALSKQTVGAVLAVGLLFSVAACAPPRARLRTTGAFMGGGVITAVVTLSAFAMTDGVGALFHSLVVLPLSFQTSFDSPMINFWPVGRFSEEIGGSKIFYLPYFYSLFYNLWVPPSAILTATTQALYAFPFVIVVATLVRRWKGPLPSAVWIQLAVVLAVISNLFPRADWGHLVAVLPSVTVLLVMIIPASIDFPRTNSRAGIVIIGFLSIASTIAAGLLYWVSEPPSFGPRVPLRAVNVGYRGESIPEVIRYLREHTEPGDAIFVARAEPLIYFATDTHNPTPYGGVIPGMVEEQQEVIKKALETTRYVVMSDVDQPVFTYYRDELPDVQKELERHYRIPEDFIGDGMKWIQVLERGPDRGATHTDLIDKLPHGRTWIHTRDGATRWAAPYPGKIAAAQNRRFLPFLVGTHGGGIDFDVQVPDNGVFQSSIGYPAALGTSGMHEHPRASKMIVSIREHDEFKILAMREVNPRDIEIRSWTPFDVDLSKYAGRRVTLRLELQTGWRIRGFKLAWWGSPRIAIRPDTDGNG